MEEQMKVSGHKLKDNHWKAVFFLTEEVQADFSWSEILPPLKVFFLLLRLFQKNTQNTPDLSKSLKRVDDQLQVKLKISWTY